MVDGTPSGPWSVCAAQWVTCLETVTLRRHCMGAPVPPLTDQVEGGWPRSLTVHCSFTPALPTAIVTLRDKVRAHREMEIGIRGTRLWWLRNNRHQITLSQLVHSNVWLAPTLGPTCPRIPGSGERWRAAAGARSFGSSMNEAAWTFGRRARSYHSTYFVEQRACSTRQRHSAGSAPQLRTTDTAAADDDGCC